MEPQIDPRLKAHTKLGTYFCPLADLTRSEKVPFVAQVRRLRGEHYSVYLRAQQQLRSVFVDLDPANPREPTEEEQRAMQKSVDSMRRLLSLAVFRVYRCGETVDTFKVSSAPVGDHADDEVSIDLFENDYLVLINLLFRKLGLLPEEDNGEPASPFPGTADTGDAGPAGEAVRAAAEPVGEGVTPGPAG